MRNLILMAVAVFLLAGTATKFAARFVGAAPAGHASGMPAKASAPKSTPAAGALDTLAVARGRDGHFHADAVIGGIRVEFLVDTGASVVALTSADAARLGITPSPRDFTIPMQTANGVVRAARVRLARVDIGPLTVSDVTAVVMPPQALASNLLGMSFLSRLRRFEFRTGQLVLEQ